MCVGGGGGERGRLGKRNAQQHEQEYKDTHEFKKKK